MTKRSLALLICLAALPLFAQQRTEATSGAVTEANVNAFLERMYGFSSEIKWKIISIKPTEVSGMTEVVYYLGADSSPTRLYVTADGQHAVAGQLIPFGNDPFTPARAKLAKSSTGILLGPAGAKVSIIVFSDLQCPHCKNAEPILEKLQQDVPGTKLIYQEYPLVQIHPWAMLAAKYSDCVGRQSAERAYKFNADVFGQQDQITPENAGEKLNVIVSNQGLDATKIAACAADRATEQRVQQSLDLGQQVGVTSTPTVFINGRKLSGISELPYEALKEITDYEVKVAK